MFKSHEAEKLASVHCAVSKMASFFCFKRKEFLLSAVQDLHGIDESFFQMKSDSEGLMSQVSSQTERLDSLGEKHDQLQKEYEEQTLLVSLQEKQQGELIEKISSKTEELGSLCSEHVQLQKEHQSQSLCVASQEKQLSELSGKLGHLEMEHKETFGRLRFVSSLLSAKPAACSGLAEFCNLLSVDFLDFANNESALAAEAEALLLLQEVERDLRTVVAYPEIFMKSVVAIGGGFSSGKSALASSFFEHDEIKLPIGIEPVTAIPTYIVSNDSDLIKGFSSNGGVVPLDANIYEKLSHDYVKSFGFNLKEIMPYMAIGTPMKKGFFEHMCLIDTPGYNPADSDGYTDEDKETAVEHLKNANALIWVVGVDSSGTIPMSDIDFLESMDLSKKHLFVVANKADLKSQGELEEILDDMAETLDDYDVSYKGLSAYSAEESTEYCTIGQSFLDFLLEQNKCLPSKENLIKKVDRVFDMYTDATKEKLAHSKSVKKEMHSLRLDLATLGVDEEFRESDISLARCLSWMTGGGKLKDRIKKITDLIESEHSTGGLKEINRLRKKMIEAVNNVFEEISSSL